MSIAGLTDGQRSFKEIGRLRKGAPKGEGLKDLTYFRPDFRPDEQEAASRFLQAYGQQPTRVNFYLAFPQIERCWSVFYMVYNTAGLLGKAGQVEGRDPKKNYWHYLRDNKTGQIIVKDCEPLKEFDPAVPVYSYYSQKKKEDVPVFAKPEGRLNMLIPELQVLSYVTLVTHSIYDIVNIGSELGGIEFTAGQVGMPITKVKLALCRRLDKISVAYNGKKSMQDKWICHVDVSTDWAGAGYQLLSGMLPGTLSLPAPVIEYPSLPANVADNDDWGDGDEEPLPLEGEELPIDGAFSQLAEREQEFAQEDAPIIPPELQAAFDATLRDGRRLGDVGNEELKHKQASLKTYIEQGPEQHDASLIVDAQDRLNKITAILAYRNAA